VSVASAHSLARMHSVISTAVSWLRSRFVYDTRSHGL
jgi:hypothetical protein